MSALLLSRRQKRVFALMLLLCLVACVAHGRNDAVGAATSHHQKQQQQQPRATAAHATLERQVDRRDWFLLDGDQLIPARKSDGEAAAARRQLEGDLSVLMSPQQQQQQSVLLKEPRRPALSGPQHSLPATPATPAQTQPLRVDTEALQSEVEASRRTTTTTSTTHSSTATAAAIMPGLGDKVPVGEETEKIALQSLRLIVRVRNNEDDDGDAEVGDEVTESTQPAARHRKGWRRSKEKKQGPSILRADPAVGQRTGEHAASTNNGVLSRRRRVDDAAQPAVGTAARSRGSRRSYTDEELRRRCVVANGRAAEPAVLRAMMEGRLRQDCLVIAADVGNDIPTNENNAKGAVTIVSLFVSMLLVVFAFVF